MADRGIAIAPRGRAGRDRVGLGRVMPGRLLPGLVAAMAFLAAMALAGVFGAAALAGRWSSGAAEMATIQVPRPDDPAASGPATSRIQAVLGAIQADPAMAALHRLEDDELTQLLRPWLSGTRPGALDGAIVLPAVVEATLHPGKQPAPDLAGRIAELAPGTLFSRDDGWGARLAALAASLQACAGLALLTVAGVAASVVAIAARAGLGARRQTIEIVHGLGASHGDVAARFAGRASWLAALGALVGGLLALPVLLALAHLAAPFAGIASPALPRLDLSGAGAAAVALWARGLGAELPVPLWLSLSLLPATAAAIGWVTAQVTVRRWLARL